MLIGPEVQRLDAATEGSLRSRVRFGIGFALAPHHVVSDDLTGYLVPCGHEELIVRPLARRVIDGRRTRSRRISEELDRGEARFPQEQAPRLERQVRQELQCVPLPVKRETEAETIRSGGGERKRNSRKRGGVNFRAVREIHPETIVGQQHLDDVGRVLIERPGPVSRILYALQVYEYLSQLVYLVFGRL